MPSGVIKNIFITNFHHKKGCEIESIYPNLQDAPEQNLWKYLPNLTLPDGAHHYTKGFVYFTLPNEIFNDSLLYGISCYKQVNAKDILNKSKDVTRSTVQKSLCILTTLPLFTYLKCNMYDALECYFDLKDITQAEFLENLYNFLDISIPLEIENETNLVYRGLSATDLFETFPPKLVLTIFKLLLLEYKVLFFGTEPGRLTQIILTFLTLLPGFLDFEVKRFQDQSSPSNQHLASGDSVATSIVEKVKEGKEPAGRPDLGSSTFYDTNEMASKVPHSPEPRTQKGNSFKSYLCERDPPSADRPTANKSSFYLLPSSPKVREISESSIRGEHGIDIPPFDQYGFPLAHYHLGQWSKGDVSPNDLSFYCPYLSLPYLDLILERSNNGQRISSCLVGASNVLFKQKTNNIFDVIVDVDSHRIDFVDKTPNSGTVEREWRRNLSLTSADSRFVQYIVRRIRLLTTPQKVLTTPLNPNDESFDKLPVVCDVKDIRTEADDVSPLVHVPDHVTEAFEPDLPNPDDPEEGGEVGTGVTSKERGHNHDNDPKSATPTLEGGESLKILSNPNDAKGPEHLNSTPDGSNDTNNTNDDVEEVGQLNSHRTQPDGSRDIDDPTLLESVEPDGPEISPMVNVGEGLYLSTPLGCENDTPVEGHPDRGGDGKGTHVTPNGHVGGDKGCQASSPTSSLPNSPTSYETENWGNIDLDAWIRGQFKLYLISLLSTTKMADGVYRPRYEEDFNPFFVEAFKLTRVYDSWNSRPHPGISEVQAGHPFQGALGMVDVKLRLSNVMANTDRGKKLLDEAAINAGKGMGMVWSTTKSVFSTLFK